MTWIPETMTHKRMECRTSCIYFSRNNPASCGEESFLEMTLAPLLRRAQQQFRFTAPLLMFFLPKSVDHVKGEGKRIFLRALGSGDLSIAGG